MVLKYLLGFGADVDDGKLPPNQSADDRSADGKTPLIHVSCTDNVEFATLLLEYGADIDAVTKDGQTPLTTAVTYNSRQVLQLLLDRWEVCSVCPRLQGPCLVNTAALYAEVETLQILVATDDFRLKYDRDYPRKDSSAHVSERYDTSEHLVETFQELTSVIQAYYDPTSKTQSLLEIGMMRYRDSPRTLSDTDESETEFHDAVDALECSIESLKAG
ncbi:ankyrin [Tothia fuscella]|uniref:Ankyrin n=1 Tax=Tothia fuscella TaxID=1048955 RepID=A0A9P4NGA8_9PEZI|nr:ankyrin [Tothia fuscella]